MSSILLNVLWAQPNIELELIASGFNAPLSIQNAGDSRLFVVERAGLIKILNDDGSVNPVPYLDIDHLVIEPGGIGNEGGLLGLAFHPEYAVNGYFFVHYINNDADSVISRFEVNPSNPDLANPNSEEIVLNIFQPQTNHNGGDLAFGPDGFLYIGLGDGGTQADSDNNGQRLDVLLGKILRIDVDSGLPYSIPSTNPFENDSNPDTLGEIWASGLRNPWRISFDPLNGDLWITDVGQGMREEINVSNDGNSGQNYGWRCYEGSLEYNNSNCVPVEEITFPIAEYAHIGGSVYRCSITGGYVYRGSNIPGFQGIYFFADYCSNEIGTLFWDGANWIMNFSSPYNNEGFAGFGLDVNNELYVAAMASGRVYRIIEDTLSQEPHSELSVAIYPNPSTDYFTIDPKNSRLHLIEIINGHGQTINRITPRNTSIIHITTSHLSKGLYIVKVYGEDNSVFHKKLVIR